MENKINQVELGVPLGTESPYPLESVPKTDAVNMPSSVGNIAVNTHFPNTPPWRIDDTDPDNPVVYDIPEVQRAFIFGETWSTTQAYVLVDDPTDLVDN